MASCALTTIDNPYNPFEEFTSWFLFDVTKGYNSCAYLGRVAQTSDQFSDDFLHIYRKVTPNTVFS